MTATFSPLINNLIFVTHDTFATTLGGVAAYDAKCNAAASAVGLNNLAGSGYIAYLSSPSSLASTRLGSARGWVRLDGRPFADTQSSLLNGQVFNPIHFADFGQVDSGVFVMTGTSFGQLGNSCSGWTSASGVGLGGDPQAGPSWSDLFGDQLCSAAGHLICVGISKTTPVAAVVTSGRQIWHTNTPYIIGGGLTPDQKCQSERPAGVTSAVAFIDYAAKSAASLLSPNQNYVRPDGTLVGTGAQLSSNSYLESGIWQSAAGTYEFASVWSGGNYPDTVGSLTTCADWTSSSDTGITAIGVANSVATNYWWGNSGAYCNATYVNLYCLQTAP